MTLCWITLKLVEKMIYIFNLVLKKRFEDYLIVYRLSRI